MTTDKFQLFDQTAKVVHIKHWTVAVRELILAVICGVLLVLVLMFAGLFGRAESELSGGGAPSASALLSTSYCETKGCLDTAARALDLMNKTVDPCDDFYQFACGNYKVVKPIPPNAGSRSVLRDMVDVNMDKLLKVIEKPVQRMTDWASERKLKEFFQGCNDMYTRERNKGKPFLEQVVAKLGGWDVIDTWDEENWDLNTVLKQVQVDFWTDALYAPFPGIDWYDHSTRSIQLYPAGTGKYMYWSWYVNDYAEKYRVDYKKFIRRVGGLLQRDAQLNMTSEEQTRRLDQFVNDTYTIEANIANIAQDSRYTSNPFLTVNKVSLRDLTTETHDVIDWVDQLSYLFRSSGVTGDTRVVLLRREYFQNMTAMIASLPDNDRKRMMHNYFIWRIAEQYVQELSWEYIHANREIYVDIHGQAQFMGMQKYCFYLAKTYLDDALSSLFVADHFNDKNKQTVHDISDNIKTALQSQLDDTPWMDGPTRQYAKDKLDRVTFKMGYPDWMANHDVVDSIYIGLNVNVTDAFANILSVYQFMRLKYDEALRVGEDREVWIYGTWETNLAVYWSWNEIIAPAGILQAPIYDAGRPHSTTFGGLGSILAQFLHHIVDDYGEHYDKYGNRMEYGKTWWSNASVTSYEAVHACVNDVYVNASKTYRLSDGMKYPIYVNSHYYTPTAIALTNGLRVALKGYHRWVSARGLSEKRLPGLHMSSNQMFFLAHAQSWCFNRDEMSSFFRAMRGRPEEDLQINMALGQLPEFSEAFGCRAGSKMNHEKKCDYY